MIAAEWSGNYWSPGKSTWRYSEAAHTETEHRVEFTNERMQLRVGQCLWCRFAILAFSYCMLAGSA